MRQPFGSKKSCKIMFSQARCTLIIIIRDSEGGEYGCSLVLIGKFIENLVQVYLQFNLYDRSANLADC